MKPGDKVWVWSPWAHRYTGVIEEGVLVDQDINGPFAYVRLSSRDLPYTFFKDEVFPTREALCEHYRKIFEPPAPTVGADIEIREV